MRTSKQSSNIDCKSALTLEEESSLLEKLELYYANGGHDINFIYSEFKGNEPNVIKYAINSAAYFDFFTEGVNITPLSRRISCEDQFFLDTGVTVAEAGIGLGTDDIVEIADAFLEFSIAYAEYRNCKELERKGAQF